MTRPVSHCREHDSLISLHVGLLLAGDSHLECTPIIPNTWWWWMYWKVIDIMNVLTVLEGTNNLNVLTVLKSTDTWMSSLCWKVPDRLNVLTVLKGHWTIECTLCDGRSLTTWMYSLWRMVKQLEFTHYVGRSLTTWMCSLSWKGPDKFNLFTVLEYH